LQKWFSGIRAKMETDSPHEKILSQMTWLHVLCHVLCTRIFAHAETIRSHTNLIQILTITKAFFTILFLIGLLQLYGVMFRQFI